MPEPNRVELNLDGPTFEQAVNLTREATTSVIHGGPAVGGSLEFVMTASVNDRLLGATVVFLLSNMSGALARYVAELEDAEQLGGEDERLKAAVQLVDEFLLEFEVSGASGT